MTSASTADGLPCPETGGNYVRELQDHYTRIRQRYAPAPKPVVIPRAKAVVIRRAKPAAIRAPVVLPPEPVAPPDERPARKIYSAPIGPVRRVIDGGDVQYPEIQRRVFTLDDLTPEGIGANDIVPWPMMVAWVCRKYGVGPVDLFSSRRTARLVQPRHELCGLAKRHTVKSLPEIGRLMGGRDHTTILHGIRKFERLVAEGRMTPWQDAWMGKP